MLPEALFDFLEGRICIFGMGNRMWRDDGVGSYLAESLAGCENLVAVDGGFVPENHLEAVVRARPDTILMIDATDFGAEPGGLRLLQATEIAMCGLSTHSGSPQMLAQYLSARTGARVALLAIQPGDVREGDRLSPEVAVVVEKTVGELVLNCGSLG